MGKIIILALLFLQVNSDVSPVFPCPNAKPTETGSRQYCKDATLKSGRWFKTPANEEGFSYDICVSNDAWHRICCKLVSNGTEWSHKRLDCLSKYKDKDITVYLYNMFINLHIYGNYSSLNITYLRHLSEHIDNHTFVNTQLLVNCLNYLPVTLSSAEIEDVVNIINNIMSKRFSELVSYKEVCLKLCNVLEGIIKLLQRNATDLTVTTSDLFVSLWHPFRNNVSRITLYNGNGGKFDTENLGLHQSAISAYIPMKFLENLAFNSKKIKREDLYVVMVIAKDARMFRDYFNSMYPYFSSGNFLALSIPGFCKKSNDTVLEIVHKTDGVLHFGQEYFDFFDTPTDKCILSKLSYFSVKRSRHNTTFESPKMEYCIGSGVSSSSKQWAQVPVGAISFKKKFCADADLNIVVQYCDESKDKKSAILNNIYKQNLECFNHSISNISQYWYESAIKCSNYISDSVFSVPRGNLTYVDTKLYFYLLTCLTQNRAPIQNVTFLNNLLVEGFVMLETIQMQDRSNRLVCVIQYFTYFLNVLPSNSINEYTDFIYVNFKPSENKTVGILVYDNNTKFITEVDLNAGFSLTDNIEMIILLTNETLRNIENIKDLSISVAVIKRNKFVENEEYYSKSRILAIRYSSALTKIPIEFQIYAKFVDKQTGWKLYDDYIGFKIYVQNGVLEMVFVQSPFRKCNCNDEIASFHIKNTSNTHNVDSIFIPVTLIQNKNWSFSKSNAETFYENSEGPLKIATFVGNILSAIGLFCIIFTAIIFQPWRKTRFCSIQFSAALACQTIFFFRDNSTLTEAEYLLFYYWSLAQYSWLLIMCFNRYIRFLSIFRFSQLGDGKSVFVGWLLPVIITLIPTLIHPECLSCNLCFHNSKIFPLFIAIPLLPVTLSIIVIYIVVMIKIKKDICEKHGVSIINIRLRASVLLLVLAVVTLFLFLMISLPWPIIKLLGAYIFYIITPLHGFILFIVIVVLDQQVRNTLFFYCRSKFGREDY